ncbi:hypothetical protein D3C72_496900 [compost metagenome]
MKYNNIIHAIRVTIKKFSTTISNRFSKIHASIFQVLYIISTGMNFNCLTPIITKDTIIKFIV